MGTRYPGTPEEKLALDTYIKLTRASESLEARLDRRATKQGLTISQFGVLESLLHLGPLTQSAIGRKLLKSSGNITVVIDNLEKRGLVRRDRSTEDRRQVFVSLTPGGEELIRRIFPDHARAIRDEISALTPEEQRELGRLCKKLGLAGNSAAPPDPQ